VIESNIAGELFGQLRGKPCRPLASSQVVKLAAAEAYVFPDATVVCGKAEYVMKRGIRCLLNPTLAVEVLSPTTASKDETDKLLASPLLARFANTWWFRASVRDQALFSPDHG
jgi:Uma2 family endonuclease